MTYLGSEFNPVFAEIVKFLLMEKKEDKVNNFEKYKKYLNLRLSLIGGHCSGKKTLSIYLKNKYNIDPINLEEILS